MTDDELIERANARCRENGTLTLFAGDLINPDGPSLASRITELKEALSDAAIALEGWHRLNFVDDIQAEVLRRAKSALSQGGVE